VAVAPCWMKINNIRFLLLLMVAYLLAGCLGEVVNIDEGLRFTDAGDWDRSVRFFQKMSEQYPDDIEVKLHLNQAKWNASLSHMAKGEALMTQDLYDEAIAEFQVSIAYYPTNTRSGVLIDRARARKESNYFTGQGETFIKAGQYHQAREAFEKALKLNPDNQKARKSLSAYEKKEEQPPAFRLKLNTPSDISLKFKSTPILNVFEVLTKLAGINFIFDKDMVDTRVTLFMTDVPFDRFLEVLLRTNGLAAKQVDERTMIVYPDTPAKSKEYEDLQIRTFYLSNLDVKKAVGLLAKVLKSKDIMANEDMNAIVIRGPKNLVEIAAKVIEANDRPPAEVMLNVELIEAGREKVRQLGLDFNPWSVTIGVGESSPEISNDTTFADIASLYALKRLSDKEVLLSLPTATLNLLKQDGNTKILANPQIRVRTNEQATIHIGSRVPLRVNRRIDVTGVVTSDFQYTDIGVKVEAAPIINMLGEIRLKLILEVSTLGPNLGTVVEPEYSILTRKAATVLTMKDGEPVVLGGLIQDTERTTRREAPWLSEIPILGEIFGNVDSEGQKTDILMSITPIVMRPQELPGAEVTQIWSGKEEDFTQTEPAESVLQRQAAYLDKPAGEDLKGTMPVPSKRAGSQEPLGTTEVGDRRGVTKDASGPSEGGQAPEKETDSPKPPAPPNPSPPPVQSAVAAENRGTEVGPGEPPERFWPENLPYSVHVGSFANRKEAERWIQNLGPMAYECFIIPAQVEGKGFFYRVFLGRFKDYRTAQSVCEGLKRQGAFPKEVHVVSRRWAFGS
jgi:general secretion pathway protein D